MQTQTYDIQGPVLFEPRLFGDDRGYFFESFRQDVFEAAAGRSVAFVQDNQSGSLHVGTVRGLHYQAPPHAQAKLVRCVSGAIIDIIVDVRGGSPTYGQSIRAELTADNHHQLFVPEGFLHGFVTTAPNSVVCYKVNAYYNGEADGSVRFDSAALGLDWGVDAGTAVLSEKDLKAPDFADWESPF